MKRRCDTEALRATELMPIAKNPIDGPRLVNDLALVYAWTGEHHRALDQLEKIATIPSGPSYGELMLDPCWDELRGNPRFDKIIAAASGQQIATKATAAVFSLLVFV